MDRTKALAILAILADVLALIGFGYTFKTYRDQKMLEKYLSEQQK